MAERTICSRIPAWSRLRAGHERHFVSYSSERDVCLSWVENVRSSVNIKFDDKAATLSRVLFEATRRLEIGSSHRTYADFARSTLLDRSEEAARITLNTASTLLRVEGRSDLISFAVEPYGQLLETGARALAQTTPPGCERCAPTEIAASAALRPGHHLLRYLAALALSELAFFPPGHTPRRLLWTVEHSGVRWAEPCASREALVEILCGQQWVCRRRDVDQLGGSLLDYARFLHLARVALEISVERENRRLGALLEPMRLFLKAAGAVAGVGAVAAALSPLADLEEDLEEFDLDAWLQQHYHELTPADLETVLRRLEQEAKARYGVDIEIRDPKPTENTKFAYALNLGVCVGCRRCAYACQKENNISRTPGMRYIRVLELDKGGINIEASEHYYAPETVPQHGKFYMPVQCHQCDNPPCTKVCPVEATWKEPDGIVVVDYNWCIGCRYCAAACPYWARRFNFARPQLAPSEINPDTAYLGNRPRPVGVMEKCTFCLHRVRDGRYPSCLEACPTGARAFGNLYDGRGEIRYVLENKRVFVLKEDVGTVPSFFYYFDA